MEYQIEEAESKLKKLEIDELTSQHDLENANRELVMLVYRYKINNRIVSHYTGRVLEVKVVHSGLIKPNTPIISIELSGKNIKELEAVIYVSSLEGKKIHSGMEVEVSPSNISREEYGAMLGQIVSVAIFPATYQAMMRVLQNEKMVEQILKKHVVIEVIADLRRSNKTVSGYQWTSSKGPLAKVQSGTLGTAEITIKRQKPITLALPLLKRIIGVH